MMRPALGSAVTLDLALEEPGRHVRADPGQLDQVLMNLAMNAKQAMPQGGVLTLRSGHATLYAPETIGHETLPAGRYVTIAVEDSGTGIPANLLGRIFEPFFTTRRAHGGSGFGLATAQGIIRQSGGFLTVESAPGQGSTFRIYLPREDRRPATARPPTAAIAPGATPRITDRPATSPPVPPRQPDPPRNLLLVDDEDAVRRVTARALARDGWQVLQADSAEAALALLDADPAIALTVLVSDVVMPGRDGAALVRDVRARYPGLPAILVSGYAERSLTDRAPAAVSFLAKPYTPRTLRARLDEIAPAGAPCVERPVPA